MRPETPVILAFDTSAAHCAAALLSGDTVIATREEPMARGQAERLMPLLEDLLSEHRIGWGDLAAIGVGCGPGNFTGIRISVAAARGLALALGIPAIGVSGFEAVFAACPDADWAIISAPRDQVYAQRRPGDTVSSQPTMMPQADIANLVGRIMREGDIPPALRSSAIARIAAARRDDDTPRPIPLYLRSADAAPARDAPPKILP